MRHGIASRPKQRTDRLLNRFSFSICAMASRTSSSTYTTGIDAMFLDSPSSALFATIFLFVSSDSGHHAKSNFLVARRELRILGLATQEHCKRGELLLVCIRLALPARHRAPGKEEPVTPPPPVHSRSKRPITKRHASLRNGGAEQGRRPRRQERKDGEQQERMAVEKEGLPARGQEALLYLGGHQAVLPLVQAGAVHCSAEGSL